MKKVCFINLILMVLIAILLLRRSGHQGLAMQPPSRSERSNSVRVGATNHASVHYDTPWQAWDAKDYPSFISMMRISGCPEQTLQDLVLMQLTREYQALCASYDEAMHMNPEWWHCSRNHASERERVRYWREQRFEMAVRVHELLGIDYGALVNRFLGLDYQPETWISPERHMQLFALLERFKDESTSLRMGTEGWWTPTDSIQKAQLAELEKSQRTQLSAFLTPAELEEYDVRNSSAANYARENLPPAASEREFRTMVKITMEHGAPEHDRIDERDFEYATAKQAEEEAKAALQRKIEAALGADVLASRIAAGAEQEKADQERQARLTAEDDAFEEQIQATRCSDMAAEIGVDPALGRKLFEQLRVMAKEQNANPTRQKLTPEQEKTVVIQTAVEIMGEKGREFVRKMDEKYEHP